MTQFVCLACLLCPAQREEPAHAVPVPEEARGDGATHPDFKLVMKLFGAGAELRGMSELVFHEGKAYQFVVDAPGEVILVDSKGGAVELLDLRRRLHTELTFERLDQGAEKLREVIRAAIRKREEDGGRASRVAAEMSRDLIEPKFEVTADETGREIRLTNDTVEIDASGVPDLDAPSLDAIERALDALAKLGAIRRPDAIPPFPRLATHAAVIGERRLRPTEISLLYRLSGPPTRYRWTFELVKTLSDREVEALERIEQLRVRARSVRFETYERAEP